MALGSQRISGRFQVKNVTLNIYLHSQTFSDLDQLTSRIYFKTNAYSFHTHLLYLCWVMNKIPDLHEHWVISQEESSLGRGGWPNSTQTKDLSVSAITVIAQFTFWLISGASAEGEYLHYIQDRSWAQLRQHSVYSHLTDCCPRSGLTQLTGRVQRERNVVQEDLGMELEDWEVKDNEQKRHNFFLKLGVMQLNEWSVKNCVEKEKEKVREEFMIHVVLEF